MAVGCNLSAIAPKDKAGNNEVPARFTTSHLVRVGRGRTPKRGRAPQSLSLMRLAEFRHSHKPVCFPAFLAKAFFLAMPRLIASTCSLLSLRPRNLLPR